MNTPTPKTLFPNLPILLVDDEEAWLHSFGLALRAHGINNLMAVSDSRRVKSLLAEHEIGVIVLDLTMPHLTGDQLLPEIVTDYPEVPVIVLTGLDLVETAVLCMKQGAFDYFTKVSEEERLIAGVRRAIDFVTLRRENDALKKHVLHDTLDHPEAFGGIVTNNKTMRSIFKYIEAISTTCEPVLITGETGCGKEMIAKAVHTLSKRSGPFVPINIAGLDESMLADTLFGHIKGAFTGADQSRSGLIDQAAGGTLFLDEIGDLAPASQIKLLRLLQENEYLPLGADLPRRTNCRMIFATHASLESLQQSGKFRKDLFYRLRAHHIHVPPLRERYDDLFLLTEHFLMQSARKLNKPKPSFPKELITLFSTYDFPGNVRELKNMLFDAVSCTKTKTLGLELFKNYIYPNSLPFSSESAADPGESPFAALPQLPKLKDAGTLLVLEALHRSHGNQAIAADMLGISRQALNWRLKPRK